MHKTYFFNWWRWHTFSSADLRYHRPLYWWGWYSAEQLSGISLTESQLVDLIDTDSEVAVCGQTTEEILDGVENKVTKVEIAKEKDDDEEEVYIYFYYIF